MAALVRNYSNLILNTHRNQFIRALSTTGR